MRGNLNTRTLTFPRAWKQTDSVWNVLLRLAKTSDQTRKHAENSAGSYLLLQRACGARRVWAGEDKDISNAQLRPAKQTKLTYSLIAFNKDNTSPEYRWDPERRRRLRAPPQTGWHTNKAEELIFNSKLWIPNRLSQRLPLPQQTFFLICSINGNSVPIKTSHPDEFNLRWSRLEQLAAQRSVTMRVNKAATLISIKPSLVWVCSAFTIISQKTSPTHPPGSGNNSEVRSIKTISSLHEITASCHFFLAITQLLTSVPSFTVRSLKHYTFAAKTRQTQAYFLSSSSFGNRVRMGLGFQHPGSIGSNLGSVTSLQSFGFFLLGQLRS